MKNFETFKCENCGSSQYKQISENAFECEYCGAKIYDDDSIKDLFMADLEQKNNYDKVFKIVKTNITEEEFFKKALLRFASNKHSPINIENITFNPVSCKYVFFAILDMDFTALSVSNVEATANNNQSVKISTHEEINFVNEKYVCVNLSSNSNQKSHIVLEDLPILSNKINSSSLSKQQLVDKDINYPTKDKIDNYVNQSINEIKNNILRNNPQSNKVVHKINKIQVFAIPEYTLSYRYENKDYCLSSFAYNLNIVGEVPIDKSIEKQKNKKIGYFNLISTITTLIAILCCCYNLFVNRSLKLLPILISVPIAIIVFLTSFLFDKYLTKRYYKNVYKRKFEHLEIFLNSKQLCLDDNDKNYINDFLRWRLNEKD